MKVELLEYKVVKKESVPQILSKIFSICQAEKNFPHREEMSSIQEVISSLENKLKHKQSLLKQSSDIKTNLNKRLSEIEESNFEIQSKLLETLGSEI